MADDRNLPDGKTCGDCADFRSRNPIPPFYCMVNPGNTLCGFNPSQFKPRDADEACVEELTSQLTELQERRDAEIERLASENSNLLAELFEPESPEGRGYTSELTRVGAERDEVQSRLKKLQEETIRILANAIRDIGEDSDPRLRALKEENERLQKERAEGERLREWVASQSCTDPKWHLSVTRRGLAESSDCGDCVPCKARAALVGDKG